MAITGEVIVRIVKVIFLSWSPNFLFHFSKHLAEGATHCKNTRKFLEKQPPCISDISKLLTNGQGEGDKYV